MRVLVIGDTHIDDPYLDELRPVFEEIMSYEADAVIHLGDYYNFNKPSPVSLNFGTEMARKLLDKYKDFTLLAGNGRHNWMNGHSVIDYLSYLGVQCVGMEYEREIDGKKILFGHHMTYASKLEYGSAHYGLEDLKKYDVVLLGHQHIPQDEQYFHHLGSVFYQHFNESKDPFKRVAVIENGKVEFIPLKSPVPMVDVTDPAKLPNINPKTKVRLIISDFETFKRHVNDLGKWKSKFAEFKYELRYQKTSALVHKPTDQEKKRALSIIDEINRQVTQPQVRELLVAQFKDA
jgi:predicted phosphodiesterase